MKHQGRTSVLILNLALFSATAVLAQSTIVSCPVGGGGDQIVRGFYVMNYGASTLNNVTLTDIPNTTGTYTLSLTARLNAYDGPLLGTQTQTITLNTTTNVTYNFGGVPVPPGSTITFAQSIVSGPDTVMFYDFGTCAFFPAPCNSCSNVVETEDTAPPLSTNRRPSVAVTITGVAAVAPIPLFRPAALLALMGMLAAAGVWILGMRA